MIRFCDIKTYQAEYDSLDKNEQCSCFQSGQQEYLVLDETIWQKGREYYSRNKVTDVLPVVDRNYRLICVAWQDVEADRELRMLRELEECRGALSFHDLNPDCCGVTIHGCNELAWHMAKYLGTRGITVNVEGELWDELGTWGKHIIPVHQNYEIWAEGVCRGKRNWRQERLRSASVEFECVNEIYEANIKAGKITDADGSAEDLVRRLREEKEIVIRGTGTKAQDAYDWLLSNGIDICAFQSGKVDESRKSLFGKPILDKAGITGQFEEAVIIECSSKHSAWGFGDVDIYDYEGYERNRRYLLLRDYIEVPENNLRHVLTDKNLIFIGDIRLCNRVYRWWKQNGAKTRKIGYWDILESNEAEIEKFNIPEIDGKNPTEDTVYLLLTPEFAVRSMMTKDTVDKYGAYIERFKAYKIYGYTDYFSDMIKSIHLVAETEKYVRKELRPLGILLGAIPPYSGNLLVRQSLAGHPYIVLMEGGRSFEKGAFLNQDLYSICIRLAEEKSKDILSVFWTLYQEEAGGAAVEWDFPYRDKFQQKMEELLELSDCFTSQELFVMFHIAYEAMYDREISNLANMIIYWEPHCWERELVREWAFWLGSKEVKGFTLCTVRNRYIHAGSFIRAQLQSGLNWKLISESIFGWDTKRVKMYPCWDERTIKFEELKRNPREILTSLCQWWGIPFSDSLLETTFHGEKAFYGNITGFDIRPAYNLYEEYFTVFDRMRICLAAGSFQKKYGYPYLNSLSFSRRELQEMFLKDFRWEELPGATNGKNWGSIEKVQKIIRHLLWLERFAEIMGIELDETYGVLRSYKF